MDSLWVWAWIIHCFPNGNVNDNHPTTKRKGIERARLRAARGARRIFTYNKRTTRKRIHSWSSMYLLCATYKCIRLDSSFCALHVAGQLASVLQLTRSTCAGNNAHQNVRQPLVFLAPYVGTYASSQVIALVLVEVPEWSCSFRSMHIYLSYVSQQ